MPGTRFAPTLSASLLVLALLPVAFMASAGSWQEMHETSDDVRLTVGQDGVATVQHHLRYRIVAGHFKTFDLAGIEPTAQLGAEATFTNEKGGAEIPARVEAVAKTPGTLRIVIDEGKGLTRGAYTVDVTYRLDLVTTRMIARDGAMWKLAWTAPPAPEGHDGARVVFDLPSAPTEPRLAAAAEANTTLPTLRRGTARDELELVRAHVPRGEAVTWAIRIDPKSLPQVTSPELRPPPPPEVAPPSVLRSNLGRIGAALGFALLAALLATVLRGKQRAVSAAARMRGAEAQPLVPMGWGLAPFLYGVASSLAFATLLWWHPVVGATLVVVAMALSSHRAPKPIGKPRGPGVWKPVADAQVLLPGTRDLLPTDTLDIGSPRAKGALGGIALAVVGLVVVLRPFLPQIAIALPLGASVLLPVFLTGTRAQLPPTPADLATRTLRPIRDALGSAVDLSHVELATIGRVAPGRVAGAPPDIDEVRLTCLPRDPMPGLRNVEIALATSPVGGAIPEVLVRFDNASSAAAKLARVAQGSRVLRGRGPLERVVRLQPGESTADATATLVGKLLLDLEGRRATDRSADLGPPRARWKGRERRRGTAPRTQPSSATT